MYRFKLNDNLKKYIREVEVVRDKVQVVGDYLRELEYECDITISIGESEFAFNRFIVVPDWEAQCFRIDKKNRGISFDHMNELFDLKNTFNIPFTTVLGGHVEFVTTWHGKMNLTNKFIELIENAYNNELVGYRYEFIPEVWEGACKINRVYSINGKFYHVWFDEENNELSLTDNSGQCHDVTALELLRGKYDYISQLSKDENGLLIPKLSITMYESKED
jgi:hypothetical protein